VASKAGFPRSAVAVAPRTKPASAFAANTNDKHHQRDGQVGQPYEQLSKHAGIHHEAGEARALRHVIEAQAAQQRRSRARDNRSDQPSDRQDNDEADDFRNGAKRESSAWVMDVKFASTQSRIGTGTMVSILLRGIMINGNSQRLRKFLICIALQPARNLLVSQCSVLARYA
jgi:hypothetical protein